MKISHEIWASVWYIEHYVNNFFLIYLNRTLFRPFCQVNRLRCGRKWAEISYKRTGRKRGMQRETSKKGKESFPGKDNRYTKIGSLSISRYLTVKKMSGIVHQNTNLLPRHLLFILPNQTFLSKGDCTLTILTPTFMQSIKYYLLSMPRSIPMLCTQ